MYVVYTSILGGIYCCNYLLLNGSFSHSLNYNVYFTVSGWDTDKVRKRKRDLSYKDDTDDSDSGNPR